MFNFKDLGSGLSSHLTAIVIQLLIGLGGTTVLFPLLSSYIIEAVGSDRHVLPLYVFAFLFFLLPTVVLEIWFRRFRVKNAEFIPPSLLRKLELQRWAALILSGLLFVALYFLFVGLASYLNWALVIFQPIAGVVIYLALSSLVDENIQSKKLKRSMIKVIVASVLINFTFHLLAISKGEYPTLSAYQLNELVHSEGQLKESVNDINGNVLQRLETMVFMQKLKDVDEDGNKVVFGEGIFGDKRLDDCVPEIAKLEELISGIFTNVYDTNGHASDTAIHLLVQELDKANAEVQLIQGKFEAATQEFSATTNYHKAYSAFYIRYRNLLQRLVYEADKTTRQELAKEINAMRDVGLTVFVCIVTALYCLLIILKRRESEFTDVEEEDLTDEQRTIRTLRSSLRFMMAFVIILTIPLLKKTPSEDIALEKPSSWVLNSNIYAQGTVGEESDAGKFGPEDSGGQTSIDQDDVERVLLEKRIKILEEEIRIIQLRTEAQECEQCKEMAKELKAINAELGRLHKEHKRISDGEDI